ncbi:MAG: DM13 domain-containing protein [Patescibacteria group bacterium]
MSRKKITLAIVTAAVIMIIFGGFWYTETLNRSKVDGDKIQSRATPISNPTLQKPDDNQNNPIKLKSGSFNFLDPAHYASGTVEAVQINDKVNFNFSSDFKTNPDGPDLFVWIVKDQDIKNITIGGVSSKDSDYINLGRIVSKEGPQSYQVTKEEYDKYNYAVVIWCKAFGVQFSNAVLK